MAVPAFTVAVDLNDDGDWADASENISAYFLAGDWTLGFAGLFAPVCADSVATLILDNGDKRFSPESGSVFSANWKKGRKIRIQSTDPADATVRTHFVGWIAHIDPDPFVSGPTRCTVHCVSMFGKAQDADSHVPIQESKTADQVIAAVIENSTLYPPGLPVRWLVGIAGRGELDTTTYLGATTDYLVAETGKTTFTYIGDKWGDGVSVLRALRDTCGREFGRLYLDRSGLLQFINRHHLIIDTVTDDTFVDVMKGFPYRHGATLYNRVIVKARTRKVSATPEILGRIDSATRIDVGSSVTVTFNYTDLTGGGAKLAGRNAIAPVQNTDYKANSAADGSGTDYTSSVTAIITAEKSTQCQVQFTSSATVPVYILIGHTLRGIAIRDYGTAEVVRNDETSQSTHGQVYPYTYAYETDNVADAEAIADHLLAIFKTPVGEAPSMTIDALSTAGQLTSALARTIFDRIVVTESQTGVSAKPYYITGEKHHYVAGKEYNVTWSLEPATVYQYWVLGTAGFSELGETTIAGPL